MQSATLGVKADCERVNQEDTLFDRTHEEK